MTDDGKSEATGEESDRTITEDAIRKSSRVNFGKPPDKFSPTEGKKKTGTIPKPKPGQGKNVKPALSTKTTSSKASVLSRKKLELEYEEAQALAALEDEADKKRFLRQKQLLELETKLKLAEVEEELSNDGDGDGSCISSSITRDRTQQWIRTGMNTAVKNPHVPSHVRQPKMDPTAVEFTPGQLGNQGQLSRLHSVAPRDPQLDLAKYMARQTLSKDLPTFNGNPNDWILFSNQFQKTSQICGYSDEENMAQLQKSLRGDALETVRALLTTVEVDRVLEILGSRFGRPEYIIEGLVKKVKDVGIVKEENPSSLISLSNTVTNLTATIESLERVEYLQSPQLRKQLVDKLPSTMKLRWGRHAATIGEMVTLQDFTYWLEKEALAATLVYTPVFTEKSGKAQKVFSAVENIDDDKASDASENKASAKPKEARKCVYCDKEHALGQCVGFKALTTDERWIWVRKNGRCFGCIVGKHQLKQCKRKACGKDDCKRKHHPLLHNDQPRSKAEENSGQPPVNKTTSPAETEVVNLTKNAKQVLLKVLPITLSGPGGGAINTYGLLDEGSTVTMIEDKIAQELGLRGPIDGLRTTWTNDVAMEHPTSRRVSVKIKGPASGFFDLEDVRTVPNLALSRQSVKIEPGRWTHLEGIDLAEYENAEPLMLIGADNAHLIVARRTVIGKQNSPIASLTALGWVLHGHFPKNRTDCHYVMHQRVEEAESFDEQMKRFWSTEDFGVKAPTEIRRSVEEQRAVDILRETTRRIGTHWETGLLWRQDSIVLPESKTAAIKRAKTLDRKAQKEREFGKLYWEKLDEIVTKGYARRLSREEEAQRSDKTWYLPHFAVTNVNKPGKIRLVFDAAAKNQGVSLNDVLLKGPDLLNNLVGVFFKFREGAVAVSGDIKEMFPQIKIREEDQHSQRFVTIDPKTGATVGMVMTSMIFGATSSPYSAQAVMIMNAKEFESKYPEATKAIKNQHYMDDYLDSFDSVEEASKTINEVSIVHAGGGFDIRNWVSNVPEALAQLPATKRLGTPEVPRDRTDLLRILGVRWQPEKDYITFTAQFPKVKPELLTGTKRPTKREALQIVMSVFDPLGLLTIVAIRAKILLQESWREGIQWDQELPEPLADKWGKWLTQLKTAVQIRVPRPYTALGSRIRAVQLHVFCDASVQAFAAAGYLRFETDDGVRVALAMAKSRVAPIKLLTVPRLELQAAVMGTRLADFISTRHRFKLDRRYLWSDSKTVLQWLRSDARKYNCFVAHRITEILSTTVANEWRWVPTAQNVADDATRDTTDMELTDESRWFSGPEFLTLPSDEWPEDLTIEKQDEPLAERKKEFCLLVNEKTPNLIDVSRFSSWTKLLRTMAWVRRFVDRSRHRSSRLDRPRELTARELEDAEKVVLRKAQSDSFRTEIQALQDKNPIPRASRLFQITPMLDEAGLLRVDGRIHQDSGVPRDIRQPIILDDKHVITRLILFEAHRKAGHIGRERVLNDVRQRFYIPKIRKTVRSIWNECQDCRIRRASPKMPIMAPLPEVRTASYVRPFTYVGVDYFGPMYVKIGRRREKRYGALFTCLTVRAVHVEIAASLSTDSMIMALRRMMARRGKPRCIYSDNGTNFVGANAELRTAWAELDTDQLLRETSKEKIDWRFIPPGAPHMGGAWERLVGSMKRALAAILHEQAPSEEVLQTLMAEAEYSVNARPLTYVSDDVEDCASLTPNHFLLITPESSITLSEQIHGAPGQFDATDLLRRKQWRTAQQMANQFWSRWIREYLPTINLRQKWHKENPDVKAGDIVVIWDSTSPRNHWKRGEIVTTFPGKDGHVRSAEVRTTSGIFRRPVSRLCVLENLERVSNGIDARAGDCRGADDIAHGNHRSNDNTNGNN